MRGIEMLGTAPRRRGPARCRIAVGLLALSIAVGARAGEGGDLRVGISKSYPPLAFVENGVPSGVDADLARIVAARLGRHLVFVPMAFPELVPALVAGKVDVVMSGLSVTDERKQKVRFTDPYLRVGQMALIRADDVERAANPEQIAAKGARVGVKKGTTGEGWARANLPEATVVSFDTIDAGTKALREGQIDYFVHDAPTVWRLTGRLDTRDDSLTGLYRPLTKEVLAWAVQADDEALAAQLNAILKDLRDSGELARVRDRWIPVTKVAVAEGGPRPTAAPPIAP